MLLMPRIHRRQIERLKSNRSIKVYASEKSKPTEPQQRPQFVDRRGMKERRHKQIPVKVDRRRQDRRNAHRSMRPEIRAMLQNAGSGHPANAQRGGVYIDEDV